MYTCRVILYLLLLRQAYQPQPQPAVHYVRPPTTNLPFISFVFALVTVLITVFFCAWIPGLVCLIPAMALSISGMSKAETGNVAAAKKFSYVSFALIVIFYGTFPILITAVIVGSIFGSINRNRYNYYYYY
jgi:hypothetical protein